jgi:hypothetical protein
MPLSLGDLQTIKYSIEVYSLSQKEALAHYALCIDFGLSGDFDDSTKALATGLKLEHSPPFRQFFQKKCFRQKISDNRALTLRNGWRNTVIGCIDEKAYE